MKLIIDIPDNEYKYTCERTLSDRTFWDDAIRKGTPLDDVKAEFIKSYPTNYAGVPEFGGMFCHFSLCQVLQILDNIGKESEEE